MFYVTPLRSTVKETVYLTVVDATVAKTVYLTVVDTTAAKTVYSTVETAQHSMALLGQGNLETFAAMRKVPDDIHLYLLFRFSFS